MTESERFERLLDEFGGDLAAATASAPPRPWRPRRAVVAICAAGAVAVIAAVVLATTGDRLDPVAEARAALAPPSEIVYMKVTSTTISPGASTVPPPQTTEQWSSSDPRRWRFVQTLPSPPAGVRGAINSSDRLAVIGGRMELSYGGGERRVYLAEPDTLQITTGHRPDDRDARIPSTLGQGSGNPEADLRSLLTDGEVTDEGERQVGGRTVRRFVSVRRRSEAKTVLRLVLDVDPKTFAPQDATLSLSFRGNLPAVTSKLHVDSYRRIPLNDTTAKLLEIQTTPRTKVSTQSADDVRERVARWKARCRPRKNGGLSCPSPSAAPPP